MDMKLQGKRALVTGSSSGIGAEIARMLAWEGADVVVHGRDRGRAKAVADEISKIGGRAALALGDLTTDKGMASTIDEAGRAFGGIDILVNNAGGTADVGLADWFAASLDAWAEAYRQNTLSVVQLVKAFAPPMADRGWGRIINISSRNAISPHPQFADYAAAKAALNNLTLSLSKQLSPKGVTVNGIMPGMIVTPPLNAWFVDMAQKHAGSSDPKDGQKFVLESVVRQTVGRLGAPEDVGAAVVYLASPRSDFVTGVTFRIDGGATPTI